MVKKKVIFKKTNSVERFVGFKLFIVVTIFAMTSSLWYLTQSNNKPSYAWKAPIIIIMIIMCN